MQKAEIDTKRKFGVGSLDGSNQHEQASISNWSAFDYGAVLSILGEGAVEQVEITATGGPQVSTR